MRHEPEHAEHNHVPFYIALNDGRYKYIRYLVKGETEEVYDLQSDPEELANLADDPAHLETLRRLRALAEAEAKRTRAGFAGDMPPSQQMLAGK